MTVKPLFSAENWIAANCVGAHRLHPEQNGQRIAVQAKRYVGIVKAVRRIAQFRRRMGEVQQQMGAMQQAEIFHLKQTIEETEAMGGDPLGDLAKQLMQELSERKIQLEIARQQ